MLCLWPWQTFFSNYQIFKDLATNFPGPCGLENQELLMDSGYGRRPGVAGMSRLRILRDTRFSQRASFSIAVRR